ncbi:uncharacterized protein METZ01_LOCUS378844, partial [marine metagenome]
RPGGGADSPRSHTLPSKGTRPRRGDGRGAPADPRANGPHAPVGMLWNGGSVRLRSRTLRHIDGHGRTRSTSRGTRRGSRHLVGRGRCELSPSDRPWRPAFLAHVSPGTGSFAQGGQPSPL